ncbi:hypothetical protein C0J52_23728 [Blattella germanica]|nr:hypothetical protein C0J52_23728 [Blattella germanica]
MLNFLQDYFNMTYPVPKLDVVALPNYNGYNSLINSLGLIVLPSWIRDKDQETKLALVDAKDSLFEFDAHNVYEKFSSGFNYTEYEDYTMYSTSRGEWILKMLNHALGKKAFKDAVRHYLLLS